MPFPRILSWLKPTYRDFLWEKFQEEYIPSCHGRRICNSVSKYGESHFWGFLKSVKADLKISYDEEIILTTRASPREVEARRALWQKPEVYSYHRFGRVCRTVAWHVLSSPSWACMRVRAKCLAASRSAKGGNWSKCGFRTGKLINTLMKDRRSNAKGTFLFKGICALACMLNKLVDK